MTSFIVEYLNYASWEFYSIYFSNCLVLNRIWEFLNCWWDGFKLFFSLDIYWKFIIFWVLLFLLIVTQLYLVLSLFCFFSSFIISSSFKYIKKIFLCFTLCLLVPLIIDLCLFSITPLLLNYLYKNASHAYHSWVLLWTFIVSIWFLDLSEITLTGVSFFSELELSVWCSFGENLVVEIDSLLLFSICRIRLQVCLNSFQCILFSHSFLICREFPIYLFFFHFILFTPTLHYSKSFLYLFHIWTDANNIISEALYYIFCNYIQQINHL